LTGTITFVIDLNDENLFFCEKPKIDEMNFFFKLYYYPYRWTPLAVTHSKHLTNVLKHFGLDLSMITNKELVISVPEHNTYDVLPQQISSCILQSSTLFRD
jgi:hypothetical protein